MNQHKWVHKKTDAESNDALARQIGHLRRSNAAFDDGAFDEGERIAATCYVLVHDGVNSNSQSLLGMLGLKKAMMFLASCDPLEHDESLLWKSSVPLCGIELGAANSHGRYVPLCKPNPIDWDRVRHIPFSQWYEESVYRTHSKRVLTRKSLILALRSTDGGAHVDAAFKDEAYHSLRYSGDPAFTWNPLSGFTLDLYFDKNGRTANDPLEEGKNYLDHGHWSSMRQIGWEVDESLKSLGY